MNKEKEIEEMKTLVKKTIESAFGYEYGCRVENSSVQSENISNVLFNNGYGNVKQALEEFSKRLIELYDDDFDDGIKYSVPCEVIIQNIKDIKYEIEKELYGE